MSLKDRFSEHEWHDLLRAPMLASFAVTAADPGGLWSTVSEACAAAGALSDARGRDSLPGEIVAEYETAEGRGIARAGVEDLANIMAPAAATEEAILLLARIAGTVERNVPEEADAFRVWLRGIAERVAEAGTEGGFLGFGGVKVSEAERKVLADIDAALDTRDTPLDGEAIPV